MRRFLRAIGWWVVVLLIAFVWLARDSRADVADRARAYEREYLRVVRSEWGLAAPTASLAAQIQAESDWNCRVVSPVGARGCAQFMPMTAAWLGEYDTDLRDGDLESPAWAFRAQAVYMRWLHDRVKGSAPCDRMAFALSAYNGGLGYVYKRQARSSAPGRCFDATCEINPGISPASQRENARYPRRVLLELEPLYKRAGWGIGSC